MLKKLASPKKRQRQQQTAGGEALADTDQPAKEKQTASSEPASKEDARAEDKAARPEAAKSPGRRKATGKKPKAAAREAKAAREGEEGPQQQQQQQQQQQEEEAEPVGAAEDATRETKRGFLKSLSRGGRLAPSWDEQQVASAAPEHAGDKEKKKEKEKEKEKKEKKAPKKKTEKEEERAAKARDDRESGAESPSRWRKKASKRRGGADADRGNNAGEEQRPAKESAAPRAAKLSPIRRQPPSPHARALTTGRFAPRAQPEVHLIGEIVGGGGFGGGADGLRCKWHVEYGACWQHVAGEQLGQTQVAYSSPATGEDQRLDDELAAVWAHPIDVHLVASAIEGWPKLVLQVWRGDAHTAPRVAGYGFASVPFAPGEHELRVRLWRPTSGSWLRELAARLTGRSPELVTDDVVARSAVADRCRLETVATGCVAVRIGVVLRNLDGFYESPSV